MTPTKEQIEEAGALAGHSTTCAVRSATAAAFQDRAVECICSRDTRATQIALALAARDATIATLTARAEKAERERDAEIGRWQEDIRNLVIRCVGKEHARRIDGSGSDGDELDFTLSEISIGFVVADELMEIAVADARRKALEEERAAVVRWLTGDAGFRDVPEHMAYCDFYAECIAAGSHISPAEGRVLKESE